MRMTGAQLRRIIREELTRENLRNLISEIDMNPHVQWDPGATRYGPAPEGWSDPGATKFDYRPGGTTRIDIRPIAGGGAGAAAAEAGASAAAAETAGATFGLTAGAAIVGAALAGLAVGTVINYGLEKMGVNKVIIDWILAQRDMSGAITFEVTLDQALLTTLSSSEQPTSFTVTGVKGMLMDADTQQLVNKNSYYSFGEQRTPLYSTAQLKMPRKLEGVFVPTDLIGKINYADGSSENLTSNRLQYTLDVGSSTVTTAVRAQLGTNVRLASKPTASPYRSLPPGA